MKAALITGITGQDGSYLAELLLEKNYQVWGMIRRSSNINTHRIEHIFDKLNLRYGDLTDSSNIINILKEIKNYEILEVYNLAAMSHVKVSFEMPEYTGNVDGLGTLRLLEAIRTFCDTSKVKFYQASTSELYGEVLETPQTETTPFNPQSPYAIAKLYSYYIVKNYRESYNLFACNGILFNHESERRGHNFVTRKITRGLKMILNGERENIILGNLDALRDWGHAKDYIYAMWLMMQYHTPEDFVIATGKQYSIRHFVETAFKIKGMTIRWKGEGVEEVGYFNDKILIKVDKKYFRPLEVHSLLGSTKKAQKLLKWKHTISFEQLVEKMVMAE